MKELTCKTCGDKYELDWNDEDTDRELCRVCELELKCDCELTDEKI